MGVSQLSMHQVGENLTAQNKRSTLFLREAEEKWGFSELSSTTGLLNSINTEDSCHSVDPTEVKTSPG